MIFFLYWRIYGKCGTGFILKNVPHRTILTFIKSISLCTKKAKVLNNQNYLMCLLYIYITAQSAKNCNFI
uniref:Uncharacterized protein n=1 Tax=Denticeps clupeoides TaxID=299321 RepID=A0AAY4D3X9_9TELE